MAYPLDDPPKRDAHAHGRIERAHPVDEGDPHRIGRAIAPVGFRGIGTREATLGSLGLFVVLGLVLAILGFAAAFALEGAAERAEGPVDAADAAAAGAAAVAILLVSLLPFLAAPLVALASGAWAGHASRSARVGAVAGAVGGFLGPILMLLLTGIGFALGAGAASLNLADARVPGGVGLAPGWGNTLPYLATGAGFLWLVSNALAGGLGGGLIGGLLDGWWDRRAAARERAARTRRTHRV